MRVHAGYGDEVCDQFVRVCRPHSVVELGHLIENPAEGTPIRVIHNPILPPPARSVPPVRVEPDRVRVPPRRRTLDGSAERSPTAKKRVEPTSARQSRTRPGQWARRGLRATWPLPSGS